MNKIAVNTFFLSVSQIISRLISFAYYIFLARMLGVTDFGVYVFTISLVYNFVPIADFGIEKFVMRDIARQPDKSDYYLQRLIPARAFLSLAAYLLLLLFGTATGLDAKKLLFLAIFGLSLFPYNLSFLLVSFYSAKEKMKYLAGANILLAVLASLFGLLALFLHFGLQGVLFAYPVACLFLAVVVFFISRNKLKLGWVLDKHFIFQSLSEAWIFGVFTIIAVFYLRTTLIMLGFLKGPELTGIYGSVFKFVEAIILIPQSLALTLFPLSSRLLIEDPKKLKKIYFKGLTLLFLLSLPVLAVMTFFSKEIVVFAYGTSYLESVKIMPILGLSLVLFFVNVLPGNIIQSSPRVKSYLPFALLIFIFLLFISFILISRYSLIGAGWAVVAGELFGFFVSNIFVFKFLKND